jgi:hypothetical protein
MWATFPVICTVEVAHLAETGKPDAAARPARTDAGTEVVEYSPTAELGRTMEVVTKNMQGMAAQNP